MMKNEPRKPNHERPVCVRTRTGRRYASHGSRAGIRRGLLAKVHIAKKELCLDDVVYREILRDEFGVETAADLTVEELGRLVERFQEKGWRGTRSAERGVRSAEFSSEFRVPSSQTEALRERAARMAQDADMDEKRLRGMVRKFCGVEDLRWAREPVRLKRLLAVLKNVVDRER